jgi:hypothetical protein
MDGDTVVGRHNKRTLASFNMDGTLSLSLPAEVFFRGERGDSSEF